MTPALPAAAVVGAGPWLVHVPLVYSSRLCLEISGQSPLEPLPCGWGSGCKGGVWWGEPGSPGPPAARSVSYGPPFSCVFGWHLQVRCLCGFLFQYPLVLFGLFLGVDASRRSSSLSTVCGSLSVRRSRSCSFVAPLRPAFVGRHQVGFISVLEPYIPTHLAIVHPAVSPGDLRRSGFDSSSFSSLGV